MGTHLESLKSNLQNIMTSEIEKLQLLDQWFDSQQELTQSILTSLNVLSREKFHNRNLSYAYRLEGKLKLEIKDNKIIHQLKNETKSNLRNRNVIVESDSDSVESLDQPLIGTDFTSKNAIIKSTNYRSVTQSEKAFETLVDKVLKVANFKVELTKKLNSDNKLQ